VLKIPISLGTVSNQEALVSRSISTEYDKYVAEILPASVKNIDETPYKQEGRGGYAWVLVSNAMTVLFYLRQSRGSKVAKEILGTNSPSYSTSDRYSAYSWIDPEKRQICFAHLLRDFTKIGERKGKAGKFGTLLVESTKELFHKWHKWKEAPEPKNKVQLNLDCKTLKERIKDTLYKGTYCGHLTTERTCKKILEVKESLWNFLEVDDLEPTNNAAERALRPLVIHRKLSFGTRSHRGTLFIERMFSILRTCKVRNINPLQLVSQKVHENFATQLA
jgi:transposase